jgi:hypothetical protein
MDLWLPEGERADRVEQHEALVRQMLIDHNRLEAWNQELKQIDERLELVRAHDTAKAPGLKPGYYHVLRHNPGGPPSLIAVEGPKGEFREPDSSLFERLKSWDCWDDRVLRDREERQRKLEVARERQQRREHEDRLDEAMLRLKAYSSPGVSMTNQGKGWRHREKRVS